METYAVSSSLKCGIINFVTCLASLFLFFHINKIHLVNAQTE